MANLDPVTNLGIGYIATPPTPATSGTTIILSTGQGNLFPDALSGYFNIIITHGVGLPDISNTEIVRCTERIGDTLTIIRGQEGTVARNVVVGDIVKLGITKKTIDDIDTNLVHKSGDTITGDIRGTDFISTRSATLTRNVNGFISQIDLQGGRTLIYTRNSQNYVISMSDSVNTWTFVRDANNRILSMNVT
jgi:hypothetical protein